LHHMKARTTFFSRVWVGVKTLATFDRARIILILIALVGSSLAFSFGGISTPTLKSLFVLIPTFVLGIWTLVRSVIVGGWKLPLSWLTLFLAFFNLSLLISVFTAGTPRLSFFGMLDIPTSVILIMALSIVYLSVIQVFGTSRRFLALVGTFSVLSYILLAFHTVRLFVPDLLTGWGFSTPTSTVVGSWYDLSIVFGSSLLMSVMTLEMRVFAGWKLWVMRVLAVWSAVFLLVMHVPQTIAVLGGVSLLMLLAITAFFYWNRTKKAFSADRVFPFYILVVFLFAISALVGGRAVNTFVSRSIPLVYQQYEATGRSTLNAAGIVLREQPLFGSTPLQFQGAFLRANSFAPQDLDMINGVRVGSGFIPTLLATTGAFGIIGILGLCIGVFFLMVVSVSRGYKTSEERWVSAVTWSLGVFILVGMAWVTTPSLPVLLLGVVFVGSWVAFQRTQQLLPELEVSFIKDPRSSFFGIAGTLAFLLVTLWTLAGTVQAVRAEYTLIRAYRTLQSGNRDAARTLVYSAAAQFPDDRTLRAAISQGTGDLGSLISTMSASNRDLMKAEVERQLGQTLSYAKALTAYAPFNPAVWTTLGDVYMIFGRLGVSGSYDNALESYQEAVRRSPRDPRLLLSIVSLRSAQGDAVGAQAALDESLKQGPSVDAYLLAARRALSQNSRGDAKQALQAAFTIRPTDGGIARDLAILLYQDKQYAEASRYFQIAILRNTSDLASYVGLIATFRAFDQAAEAQQVELYVKQRAPQLDLEQVISSFEQSFQTPIVALPPEGETESPE
jgi:tetratricopeptide (TPR) repeat protein